MDAQQELQRELLKTLGEFAERTGAHDIEIMAAVVSNASVVVKHLEEASEGELLKDLRGRPGQGPVADAFYNAVEALLKLHAAALDNA